MEKHNWSVMHSDVTGRTWIIDDETLAPVCECGSVELAQQSVDEHNESIGKGDAS